MLESTLKLLAEKLEEERINILENLGDLMIAQRHIADLAKNMEMDDE
jgi:hypothetical protein